MTDDDGPVTHYLQWARRPRSAIWLHLVGVVLMFLLWQVTAGVLLIAANSAFGKDTPEAEAMFPLTFLGPALALFLLVLVLFGRPVWRVALPAWPPRWGDYGLALLIGLIAQVLTYLVLSPWLDISYVGWGSQSNTGAALLVAMLVGLVVQTGFEELYFRGLIMQATYRITRWIPAVIGVQALFFAQLHTGNISALGGGVTAMMPYLIAAVGFGYVAWRTGSLMMSMALHLANNAFVIIGVGVQGDVLAGPAAWVSVPTQRGTILFAVVYWTVVLAMVELAMRRRREPVAV